jgi:membrane-associated protease RseP (regulator of RpoE activity)
LSMDSIPAYRLAAASFEPLGYTPLFRKDGDAHLVLALPGTLKPPPSRAWVNVALFAATCVSVLWLGAEYVNQYNERLVPVTPADWLRFLLAGWPFLVSMLGILLAHEFGHYFAARYHKVAVTLPYFIPFPLSPFGTLGAFIRLKAPPVNRRALLDIAVAGPLAGLVVAIPVLIYGQITSRVGPILPAEGALVLEGNSIFYVFVKWLVHHQLLPAPASFGDVPAWLYMLRFYVLGRPAPVGGVDVQLNVVAWAGWAGLLVTGLNLIPAGQLDGGHALYVLIGRHTRRVLPVVVVALVVLGFLWQGWFLYAALIFFMGRMQAEPLDQITELDPKRRALAILVLVIFVLIFTPVPIMLLQ